MYYQRGGMEKESSMEDHAYLKRRKIDLESQMENNGYSKRRKIQLSPTDSGFGDLDETETEFELDNGSLSNSLLAGEILKEKGQQYSEYTYLESTDTKKLDYPSHFSDKAELVEDNDSKYSKLGSTDSESLTFSPHKNTRTEFLEKQRILNSQNSYREKLSGSESISEVPDECGETEEHGKCDEYSNHGSPYVGHLDSHLPRADGTELLEERIIHDPCRESKHPETISHLLDETNAINQQEECMEHDSEDTYKKELTGCVSLPGATNETKLVEKHNSEYSYKESKDSESFSGVPNKSELEKSKKHDPECSVEKLMGSVEAVDLSGTTQRAVDQLPEHDKSYSKGESTESVVLSTQQKPIDKIELIKKEFPEMSLNEYLWLPRFNDDSSYYSYAHQTQETGQQQLQRLIFINIIENEFEEFTGEGPEWSGENALVDSMDDLIFSQFNVTSDMRSSFPDHHLGSSEFFWKKEQHFIASLLKSMSSKDKEVEEPKPDFLDHALAMKEGMRGDRNLQIYWLAACLIQLFRDMFHEIFSALEFYELAFRELECLFEKMSELSVHYLKSQNEDGYIFKELIEYLDDLQTEFSENGECLQTLTRTVEMWAKDMLRMYNDWRINYENSEEDYSYLCTIIHNFYSFYLDLCDGAALLVKRCKEFYRVRSYILSRVRKN